MLTKLSIQLELLIEKSGLLYSLAAEYQNYLTPGRDEMLGIYDYHRVFEYHGYDSKLLLEEQNEQNDYPCQHKKSLSIFQTTFLGKMNDFNFCPSEYSYGFTFYSTSKVVA